MWSRVEDPYQYDVIRHEQAGKDPDEIVYPTPVLDELVEKYDCEEYVPYVGHLMLLLNIKETIGFLPIQFFGLDYDDLIALTILQDEITRKASHEAYEQSKNLSHSNAAAKAKRR